MIFDRMVAITGGVGSGKTFISRIFEKNEIPVFNTDDCAKKIMNKDSKVVDSFCDLFGSDIYNNGELDRRRLGNMLFSDKKNANFIEDIVYPAVLKEFLDWKSDKIHKENFPFVMMESAILTESRFHKIFEFAIFVEAPLEIRKERIMRREGMTKEFMEKILNKQNAPEYVHYKLSFSGIDVRRIYSDDKRDVTEDVKSCIEYYKNQFEKV